METQQQTPTKQSKIKILIRKLGALLISFVGFLLSIPFVHLDMTSSGSNMTAYGMFTAVLIMIGAPMFFFGIAYFFRKGGHYDTNQAELKRIRYAAETQMMNDYFKKK